jgi:CHAT domain-containing protein
MVSSYTPTLIALLQARQGASAFDLRQIKLMTVAAEHAQDASMPPLRYAVRETRSVNDTVTRTGASGAVQLDGASKDDVLATLQSSQVVHLACHGIQHQDEPHKSHFCLSTGNLAISELMEMNLKGAFLAYLSACETAKGDMKHADEAVHLAASMLFAGFRSVVATMW